MKVTVLKESYKPTREEIKAKAHADSSIFYILILQKGRQRYLKIGTTTKTLAQRLSNKDYKQYTNIKVLYVAELTCEYKELKRRMQACKHVEDLTRSAIRELKGFTFIENDRFQYFNLPEYLPMYTNFGKCQLVKVH
jgi:hypothetical protein